MAGFAHPGSVVLECPDPTALAAFYSELTGWPIVLDEGNWVTVDGGEGITLSFQQAPGYQPPVWPDPASSMQYHIDFDVEDIDEAEQRVLALGATKFEHQPAPDSFRVFADPVGHVFCLCV
jgi:predicted enzyme related to lactoylglutathione lyase